jgi:hypothetical protein
VGTVIAVFYTEGVALTAIEVVELEAAVAFVVVWVVVAITVALPVVTTDGAAAVTVVVVAVVLDDETVFEVVEATGTVCAPAETLVEVTLTVVEFVATTVTGLVAVTVGMTVDFETLACVVIVALVDTTVVVVFAKVLLVRAAAVIFLFIGLALGFKALSLSISSREA